ncbi:hypothetical protein HEB94_000491 [Actinopolymorpha pittospori]|uniref:Uncharacterized protein n=1 Tax=Actinopolymorpha pittospori TaxID=648752 RepID=A0A927MRN7_9ACTN|nr:hypothetical protein [Actinopolymorpha pittospori]
MGWYAELAHSMLANHLLLHRTVSEIATRFP